MIIFRHILRNSLVFGQIKVGARAMVAVRNMSENPSSSGQFKGHYDIIVAGGGMVGCTMACALGKNSVLSNLNVLLLEGSQKQKYSFEKKYSNRVSALNPNTKSLMSSLGAWFLIEKTRMQPVRHMQVWDACSEALISFSSEDINNEDIAYIVENDLLLHSVNLELSGAKNIQVLYGAKVAGYELGKENEKNEKESVVKLANGDFYTCSLLIGADGAKSAVRDAMKEQYMAWDYDQMGIVATLELAEEIQNETAWQRFLPTGPVALLPLDSKHSSLVWSTTKANASELLQLPDEQFVDALNDALWKQYPRTSTVDTCTSWVANMLKQVGLADGMSRQLPPSVKNIITSSRAAFPLGFGHSTRYVSNGVALIGDAAHRVHPLAGQGVNLGFGDVKDLVDELSNAVYSGLEITHHSWLENYEKKRTRHNVPTQLAVDALHRLYTADIPPIVLLRSVGLQLTNAFQPIKKMIMSQATT